MTETSNTWAPGSGPRIAFSKNLRGQGSGLSTCQAEGGPHAPEEAAPPPTVGFRVIIEDLVQIPEVTLSLVVGKVVNLLLCPVREHMIDVRMTQGPIREVAGRSPA